MSTGLSVFDETIHETNAWLKDLQHRLEDCGRHQAYSLLRATLHVLRDRLPPEAALHLAAQMPMLVRGFYLEGWTLAGKPTAEHDIPAFLSQVRRRLPPGLDIDLDRAVRAVFSTMGDRLAPHGMAKLLQSLPRPLRELWYEGIWEG